LTFHSETPTMAYYIHTKMGATRVYSWTGGVWALAPGNGTCTTNIT